MGAKWYICPVAKREAKKMNLDSFFNQEQLPEILTPATFRIENMTELVMAANILVDIGYMQEWIINGEPHIFRQTGPNTGVILPLNQVPNEENGVEPDSTTDN